MSQAESPETEVRCCVGDGTKTVLNGVDGLVNKHLTKLKLQDIKRKKNSSVAIFDIITQNLHHLLSHFPLQLQGQGLALSLLFCRHGEQRALHQSH